MSDAQGIQVSVIICVKDGMDTIETQLKALDSQVSHPSFEVVIVDNGSHDGTVDLVRRWIAEQDHSATRVKLVEAGGPPGIPRVRNIGAVESCGRVLAFCDADDAVVPIWVGSFARAVDGEQLAGGRIRAFGADGAPRPEVYGDRLSRTPYLDHVGSGNCAVARSTFFAVGGYGESLPRYGFEDVDFSWRVQEAGYPLIYVRDAEIRFNISDARSSLRKRFLLGQGRVLMARRFPQYDATTYTVARSLRDLAAGAGSFVRIFWTARSIDRRSAGQIVALAGRVIGCLRYRPRRPMARKLIFHHGPDDGASR